jgi:hypothetical protein
MRQKRGGTPVNVDATPFRSTACSDLVFRAWFDKDGRRDAGFGSTRLSVRVTDGARTRDLLSATIPTATQASFLPR